MSERPEQGSDKPAEGGHGLEYGGQKDGERQKMDRRLFMELLVFDTPPELHAGEVIAELGKALDEAGIAIPFPQMDVHLDRTPVAG